MIDTASMDSVLVGKKPEVLVLHSRGNVVGYGLVADSFLLLVRHDGKEIVKTTPDRLDVWLERLNAEVGRPVGIWE